MPCDVPEVLVQEASRERVSLFLGAGASSEAGFPSSDDLASYLARAAGAKIQQVLTDQPLDFVAQYLYEQSGYGKQWVRENIITYFEKAHRRVERPPTHAHAAMTKIRWRSFFTTNYDRLVEIAYDSEPDSVQRVLPIYAPDLQILRHSADVIRLIKLNGSVDEAARNSAHELVITFAEQQDARSRHKQFYELLREEAVNGPIIFIGFRFIHPGASLAGTSPEFQLLREVLREMGPAARWHYCVCPFDPSSPASALALQMLQANKISVINAHFGDFLTALTERLPTPGTPLSQRQSIFIPIAHTNVPIEADEYEKDKRHFELLGSHIETLSAPSVQQSLNGEETWASFFHGHFIERSCTKDFKEVITKCIANAPELLCFVASPGWGKSVFLRNIAVDYHRAQRPVFCLNPYSTVEVGESGTKPIILGRWDTVRIDRILAMIGEKAEEHSLATGVATAIIVADNCPERVEEVLSLYKDLRSSNRSFVIIFPVRDYEFEELKRKHPILSRVRRFQPEGLYDSKEEVRKLIDFCGAHSVAHVENATQREIIAQRIIQEEANVSLILALQVIFDKEHRPFSEIVRGFWQNLEDEISRKLVLRVASIHRFGSTFSPRLYSLLKPFPAHEHAQVLETYAQCLRSGVLHEHMSEDEPCVSTLHPLLAEKLVQVSGIPSAEIDDELIGLIAKM